LAVWPRPRPPLPCRAGLPPQRSSLAPSRAPTRITGALLCMCARLVHARPRVEAYAPVKVGVPDSSRAAASLAARLLAGLRTCTRHPCCQCCRLQTGPERAGRVGESKSHVRALAPWRQQRVQPLHTVQVSASFLPRSKVQIAHATAAFFQLLKPAM
jgi:hypothetical protein